MKYLLWHPSLTWRLLIYGVAGVAFGFLVGEDAAHAKMLGDYFLGILGKIIPALIIAAIAMATAKQDFQAIWRDSRLGVIIYLGTSMIAAASAVAIALYMMPGAEMDPSMLTGKSSVDVLPLGKSSTLQIVGLALMLGLAVRKRRLELRARKKAEEQGQPLTNLTAFGEVVDSIIQVTFDTTYNLINCLPIAVFGLMAWMSGTMGIDALTSMGAFIVSFLISAATYYTALLVLGLVVIGRLPLWPFVRKILPMQILAFTVSSSKAVLPALLRHIPTQFGVKPKVADIMLPLGASINMDGTALYIALGTIFGAQIFGIDLAIWQYVLILFLSTLGSIGAGGIPSGSLMLMSIPMTAIGMTPEQATMVIGTIWAIDRPLDMIRTAINSTADSMVTILVAKLHGVLDKEAYKAPLIPTAKVEAHGELESVQ